MGQLWIKKEVQFLFSSSNIGVLWLLWHSESHKEMMDAFEQTQKWPRCAVNANWMALLSCSKQPFILCPRYALLGWDVEVKQTTKAMKEKSCYAPATIQWQYMPWDMVHYHGLCASVDKLYAWRDGCVPGKHFLPHRRWFSFGENKEFQSESRAVSRTSYFSAFFTTLRGALPLCKITRIKQIV